MKNNSNIYLCSFASDDLKRSVKRFLYQANLIELYKETKVFGFNDLSLKKKKQIDNFNKKKKRLFGYGCWKPEIILNYLNFIPENSILQYSDIGCHFNYNGQQKLTEYINLTNEKDILGFQYKKPNFSNDGLRFQIYQEYEYVKGDLVRYLKLDFNNEYLKTEQFCSGTIFFKNNKKSKLFLEKWLEISNIDKLIDDSESEEKNHKLFKEHRHDQSIFSLLCKIENIYSLSASEIEWAEDLNGKTWKHLNKHPILAKRDKKYNFFTRFINRQKKNFNRLLNK